MSKTYAEVMKSLTKEQVDVDYENIPDEREFREPPQPGSFRFKLPPDLQNCLDILNVSNRDAEGKVILGADGKPTTHQRINLILDGPNALVIVASPGGRYNEEPFSTRISNAERRRFVSKGQFVNVSDMTYLLRALAPDAKPKTNEEFAMACIQLLGGKEFGADVEWSGFCNPQNDAYFQFTGEAGEVIYEPAKDEGASENRKGCGKRVYSNKWPKAAEGGYAERAQCECSAWLRPFANLAKFKA